MSVLNWWSLAFACGAGFASMFAAYWIGYALGGSDCERKWVKRITNIGFAHWTVDTDGHADWQWYGWLVTQAQTDKDARKAASASGPAGPSLPST